MADVNGIFGFVTCGDQAADIVAGKMARSMPGSIKRLVTEAQAAMGYSKRGVTGGSEVDYGKSPSPAVVFYGRIDNREEIGEYLAVEASDVEDAALVKLLWLTDGPGFVERVKGAFAAGVWDAQAQKLALVTDRFGTHPVYLMNRGKELGFASTVKALMACPGFDPEVDHRAVADFFSFGYLLGDRTLFSGTRLLPPGTVLIWEKGEVTSHVYWRPVYEEDYPADRSVDDYADELYFLLRRAVDRQLNGDRIACQLSGGLDSRTVAALTGEWRADMPFSTWGIKGCDDEKFARRAAKSIGGRHQFFELSADFLVDEARAVVLETDGMLNVKHSHFTPFLRGWSERFDSVLGGVGGGELLWYNSKVFDRPVEDIAFDSWNYYIPESDHDRAFSPDVKSASVGIRDRFSELLAPARGLLPQNAFQYFVLAERSRRFNFQCIPLYGRWLEYRMPFYDYDLVDFSLRLPPHLKSGAMAYARMFRRRFPELAAVPWEKTRLPVGGGGWKKNLYRARNKVVRRADSWSRGAFGRPLILEQWEDLYADWFRTNDRLREFVKDKILGFDYLEDYLQRPYVEELIDAHMQGRANLQEQLGVLLTFALWHEQFIEKGASD